MAALDVVQAMLIAYREWAITHVTDFQLIYGNPIPDYSAPAEITVPLAARPLYSLLVVIEQAIKNGEICGEEKSTDIPFPILQHIEQLPAPPDMIETIPLPIVYLVLVGWSRIHGMIMLEIFDHSPPVIGDVDAFYHHEIERIIFELKHY